MDKIIDLAREVFHGKTIGRILFNWEIKRSCKDLKGKILDLGAGSSPSYYRYLPEGLDIISTDLQSDGEKVIPVDLNEVLPFEDKSFNTIFFFNAIYILEDRIKSLGEVHRVLSEEGTLYLSSPFLYPEIPEPHDYAHLTYEGLERELKAAGFTGIEIKRIGGRATAAASLFRPYFVFNFIRFFAYLLCIFLDKQSQKRPIHQHAPVSYFCVAKK